MKNRIGETNIATNGQRMTIITYNGNKSLDVEFEDGTIVRDRAYHSFKSGSIKNPNYITGKDCYIKNKRMGETNINASGQKMTIIRYKNSTDIDVKFDDGTIIRNRQYGDFKSGKIANHSYRIGETSIATNGQKMTIINYRTSADLDVQFEDGTIVKNKEYASFKLGNIRNPNKTISAKYNKVGVVGISRAGQKMTIIKYNGASDIDIQFEDGTIVKHKSYTNFKSGYIKNPNFKKTRI